MTVPSGEVTVLMSWPRFVEAGRVNLMTAGTATTHRSRTVAIHRSGDAVPRAQAHHRSSPPWRDLAASASLLVRIRMLVPSDAACSSGASANTRVAELQEIARWLAGSAKGGDAWGTNLIALGDFNIDRQDDPLYQAFTSTGLRPPAGLHHVPRTIFDDPDPAAPP